MKRLLSILLFSVSLTVACDDDKPEQPTPSAAPPPAKSAAAAPSASAPAPEQKAPPRPLNVLVISVDSLRADMPWTGYERKIAPNLSALAEKSVVYENAYSTSSYTAQTVASWLSGRYASSLYRAGWFFAAYSKANTFFPEVLAEQGVSTISWHGHAYFNRGKGLDQGFSEWHIAPGVTFDPNTDNNVTSEKMTKLGIELLSKPENTGKQFFAWAHYLDPHDQYIKHATSPDFGNSNRDRYDNEVHHTDKWIAELLDFAKKQPWWKDTALIITSDHGEAFGDHGMWKHAFEIWEVLVRVPLMVSGPGIEPKRIKERRSLIDLAPTIMELMGKEPLASFQGKSLVPELYGKEPPKSREPILVQLAEDSHNPPRRGVISGDYKLIVYGKGWKHMLFNIKKDPGEEKDLSKEEPEKLEEMKQLLDKEFEKLGEIEPYGGMKLKSGSTARGPMGPPKSEEPDAPKKDAPKKDTPKDAPKAEEKKP